MLTVLLMSSPGRSQARRLLMVFGFRPKTPKRNALLVIGYLLLFLLVGRGLLGIL